MKWSAGERLRYGVDKLTTGRREEITTWVTTNGEVTASVHAEEAVAEVALHGVGEAKEVLAVLDERGHVRVLGPSVGCGLGDVAAEAARVVA